MNANVALDQTISSISKLGYNFGEVAKVKSPVKAISMMLEWLGNTFQCDRVYLFEKNKRGNYDCTEEWVTEKVHAKKHLLQDIDENGVRYYYNYFVRGKKLIIRNMEEFKQRDYTLYKILKPQQLDSLICGQLVYNDKDLGFVGIDNPVADKFKELVNIYEIINYYISILIHKKRLLNKLQTESQPVTTERGKNNTLYGRIAKLRMEEPLAIVYCEVSAKIYHHQDNVELKNRVLSHAENVLSSIFDSSNVFYLGRNEFLIFYEDTEDMDISVINHYLALAKRTLEAMNIISAFGVAETKMYANDFFELVNKANVKMLRQERKYRGMFMDKYHMQNQRTSFMDLIEIHPNDNYYHVLYSEYPGVNGREGTFNEILEVVMERIHPNDKQEFIRFWKEEILAIPIKQADAEAEEGTVSKSFSVIGEDGRVTSIEIVVTAYTDIRNQLVLMCYTR